MVSIHPLDDRAASTLPEMATSQRRTIGVTALVIAVTPAAALSEPPDWLETTIWWVIAGAVLVAVLALIPVTADHLPRIYLHASTCTHLLAKTLAVPQGA